MKKFLIKDEIYGQNFFLVVNCDKKTAQKNMDKWTGEKGDWEESDSEPYGAVFEVYGKQRWRFVWLSNFDWSIKDQGVFVHELNHHCNSVFEELGLKDRNECYAYYFEMMFKKSYQKLQTLHKKLKKK